MKEWQNCTIFKQKIYCSKNFLQKITAFEEYEYFDNINEGFIECNIPIKDCCSLRHLIDSLKLNFLKIYKGQVLTISYEILQHLIQLHSNNLRLSHGQLVPKNIYIQLKPLKNSKFTIYQVPIYIKKINFVNYKIIEDENYQINQLEDVKQIINSLQQFIESIEDYKDCQLLQLINQQMIEINSNLNQQSLSLFVAFINTLIHENVDQQTQQIIQGTYKESPNWESSLGFRKRSEKRIMNYIKQLSVWDLNFKIAINTNDIQIENQEPNIIQNGLIQLEEQNCNQEDIQIKQILLDNLKNNTIMMNFWDAIGQDINSWVFTPNTTLKKFEERINLSLYCVQDWFEQIRQAKTNYAIRIPERINDIIPQKHKFKFQIDLNEQNNVEKLFHLYLSKKLIDFNIFNESLGILLNQIEEAIMKDVLQKYNNFLFLELSKKSVVLL